MYAFVQNGIVKEHGISLDTIQARGVSRSLFVQCIADSKPELEYWQTLQVDTELKDNIVYVRYTKKDRRADDVLQEYKRLIQLKQNKQKLPGLEYLQQLSRLYKLTVRQELAVYLDRYALDNGYKSFKQLISYVNSEVAQYQEQAKTALESRDILYLAFDEHFKQVYRMRRPPAETFAELFTQAKTMLGEMDKLI